MSSDNPWFRTTGDAQDFWLVQRMSVQTYHRPNARGIDKAFRLQYMGAAEYEGDMARLSLTAMRQTKTKRLRRPVALVIRERLVTRANRERTVYFVGAASTLDTAIASFDEWAAAEHLRAKEMTYFDERFAGEAGYHEDVVAWWAYRAQVMFTLDRDIAETLLAAVLDVPAAA